MGSLQRFKKTIFILLKLLLGLIIIVFLAYLPIHLFHFLGKNDAEEVHFFIFAATVALGIIAYYEFNRSNKLTANEFLLFTSNRWSSKEIIKARQILHEIFIDIYRNEDGSRKCEFNVALYNISEITLRMSKSRNKDFIYLLNLLDYLETLSYFYNRGELNLPDIQNTCGNNAVFIYDCFRLYIENRQTHDKRYFSNYTALYHDLKKADINIKQ